jgi:hypothetical protein
VPSFTCPRCLTITTEATNVASGYCTSCRDWTGARQLGERVQVTRRELGLAAQDELAL